MDKIKQEYLGLKAPESFYEKVMSDLPMRNKKPKYLLLIPLVFIFFFLVRIPHQSLEISMDGADLSEVGSLIMIDENNLEARGISTLIILDLKGERISFDLLDANCMVVNDHFEEVKEATQKGNYHIIWDIQAINENKIEKIQINTDYITVEKMEEGFKISHIGGL